MSGVARYQRGEQLRRDGQIVTSRGVDAVTGLAVFIYDFPGPPRVKPGQFVAEGVPAILAAGFDGEKGVLVTAAPEDATLIAPGESVVDDRFVLQALTVLRDTSKAGLVHGDIQPGRFLYAHGKLFLEGYGVPWNPSALRPATTEAVRAALARDLAATVSALLGFGHSGISSEVAAALKGALSSAIRVGDATHLYGVVRRLAGGAVTVPSAGFSDLELPTEAKPRSASSATALDGIALPPALELDEPPAKDDPKADGGSTERPRAGESAPPAAEAETAPKGAALEGSAEASRPAQAPQVPEPITLQSDPGIEPPAAQAKAGFVKDLPPGAKFRAGDSEVDVKSAPIKFDVSAVPKPRRRRRPSRRGSLLLVTVLALALGGGYLALVNMRRTPTAVTGAGTVSHIVDVQVEPGNLPPVSLVVDQSPNGSAYRAGTIIASVPRRVRFDANGTWVVHATYLGRRSESVTLQLPEQSTITVTFPDGPPAP